MSKYRLLVFLSLSCAVALVFWQTWASTPTENETLSSTNEASSITAVSMPASAATNSAPNEATSPSKQKDSARPDQNTPSALPSDHPISRIRAIQEKTALHESLLEDYQQHQRYPAQNRTFASADSDPTLMHYSRDVRQTFSEDKQFALQVASDKKYYLPTDRLTLEARLFDSYGEPQSAELMAQMIDSHQRHLGYVKLADISGTNTYISHIDLANFGGQALQAGLYKVLIAEARSSLVDAVAFVVSDPVISTTGEYRESLTENGDLLVEVEVSIREANRYYAQASLYTQSGQAIGTTQFAEQLAPGKHWLSMPFHGLMIRDSGEPGPYQIKHLSLAKVGVPMERMPLIHNVFETDSYSLSELNAEPHNLEPGIKQP